jgi:hypothetical protein
MFACKTLLDLENGFPVARRCRCPAPVYFHEASWWRSGIIGGLGMAQKLLSRGHYGPNSDKSDKHNSILLPRHESNHASVLNLQQHWGDPERRRRCRVCAHRYSSNRYIPPGYCILHGPSMRTDEAVLGRIAVELQDKFHDASVAQFQAEGKVLVHYPMSMADPER